MSGSDLLRRAAETLRQHAQAAYAIAPDSTGHMPWSTDQHGGRCATQAQARFERGEMSRPSVHKPMTKSYAIDQITDIERLRAVAHRMWEAFLALHDQTTHVYTGECPACNRYVSGDSEVPCGLYTELQKKITDGFGSI